MYENIIEIEWKGPFAQDDINDYKGVSDYGLYQIYGTHQIYGYTLLYIGKAAQQNFATRIKQHDSWMADETSEIKIYLGRFGSTSGEINDKEWSDKIDVAERLLIYYCSPPYNSSLIFDYKGENSETLVLNFGKSNLLPYEVSTYWYFSDYWGKKEDKWKLFER